MSMEILYEDTDIMAVNKPAGLVVHPDGRTKEDSVSEWFLSAYPEAKDVGEPFTTPEGETIDRPGIVHRLDRDTSGVLLLAKTSEGHKVLKEQFQERVIDKTYHVFVYGNIKDDEGVIDKPIGRSAGDFRKWSAEGGARGELREATTNYKVLRRDKENNVTLVEVKPKTGRTHQIRVHMKALHHPVVCDKLYVPKRPCLLGFDRLALHAYSISFKNVAGKGVSIEAPYPEDFKQAMDIIG